MMTPRWQIVTTTAGHHARLVKPDAPDGPVILGDTDCLVWSETEPGIEAAEDYIRQVYASFYDTQDPILGVTLAVEYVDARDPIPVIEPRTFALVSWPEDPLPDLTGMPIPYDPAAMP